MTEKKPSEVFLGLVHQSAPDLTPAEFAECAAAWRQIVSLEEIYAAAELRQRLLSGWSDEGIAPYTGTKERTDPDTRGPEGTGEDTGGGVEADGPSGTPAPTNSPVAVTYDCASAPMPDPEAAEKAAAARSDAGKASMITRKRRALERLEAQRSAGVTLAEIAGAARGLTLSDVMDFLDRKPVPLPKLAALEKALNKLEEASTGD